VNDDDSVRRLKGPQRPITPLDDRLRVLAELSCIDHIVPFGGDTAVELVDAIHPDVFVKGGDRTIAALPEAPAVTATGGRVQILPYEEDQSTTGIIERIRRVTTPASGGAAVAL
jgi:D-beta-D-heptose 7-phosphate kinase/D-beta-D-heptose 1-phosphate adenosyltransferase